MSEMTSFVFNHLALTVVEVQLANKFLALHSVSKTSHLWLAI